MTETMATYPGDGFMDRELVERLIAGDERSTRLADAFIWNYTPEGFDYWSQVVLMKRLDETALSALRRILAEHIAAETRP